MGRNSVQAFPALAFGPRGNNRFRVWFLLERFPPGEYGQSEVDGSGKPGAHREGEGAQMISLNIAKKYAKALLEAGLKDGNYETLGQDLNKMADLLKENKELRVALWSPAFPKPTRKAIGRKIGERLGLATTTLKFIELLIQKKRMDLFFEITKVYRDLGDEVAGRTRATLVIPRELPSDYVQEIKNQMESLTGKEVILSLEKNPSLIGGFLTKIGNVVYDGSLKAQMAKLQETLYKE
jgi:F-type H+-transporting ATPase subunit delta